MQVTLAEPVARLMGRAAGDRIALTDRRTGRVTEVVVAGVWRPVDAGDPYWRLVPDVATGVRPGSATYGPLVVDRADFAAGFATSASAGLAGHPAAGGDHAGRGERASPPRPPRPGRDCRRRAG